MTVANQPNIEYEKSIVEGWIGWLFLVATPRIEKQKAAQTPQITPIV
jgi:hypothetical protein